MCSPAIIDTVHQTVGRRGFLKGLGAIAAAGALGRAAAPRGVMARGGGNRILDLTHLVTPAFPVFPGYAPMEITPLVTVAQNGFYANRLTFVEHTGTHMDAPAHFAEGMPTAEQLPVEQLFAPLAVIDIAARAASDADAQVFPDDILGWEERYGRLPRGALVAMYSGWETRLPDAAAFLNQDAAGTLHFPGFSPEAAAFLVEDREIVGVGVDTLSLDFGASTTYGTHLTVLSAGRYGLENLANLATVPPDGASIIVGAPKHAGASGGPSRVFAVY